MTAYRLKLPWRKPPPALWGNARTHWRARARDTREVRTAVALLARQAGIPRSEHLTVELLWAPGDCRRRDADNLWPLLKAASDSLARGRGDWIGLDLVPDDTPKYFTKLAPRILPPDEAPEPGMWLVVTTPEPAIASAAHAHKESL